MRIIFLFAALSIIQLSGCAERRPALRPSGTTTGTNVFTEVNEAGGPPGGFADLCITASFKTHQPGAYSKSDVYGTADYRLLLEIDGQPVHLQGNLQREKREPIHLIDPEAGDGIRYRFDKRVRLPAGTHRIVVALPEDGLSVQRDIAAPDGETVTLVVEPVYSAKPGRGLPGRYGSASFQEGIRSLSLTLNGREP